MNAELDSLIKKLNKPCLKAIQKAAELCVSNTNYNVELEHLVAQLLEQGDNDIVLILDRFGIQLEKAVTQCARAIDHLKRGNTRTPAMSPHIVTLLEEAWMASSTLLGEEQVRSGALLIGLVTHHTLRGVILESIPILLNVPVKTLTDHFQSIVEFSFESGSLPVAAGKRSGKTDFKTTNSAATTTETLQLYTVDITEKARRGEIDPVEGRDREIRQIIDILMRRRQNNPILTGDAGVGKTAVVEGFAQKIVSGDVTEALKSVSVLMLDLGMLQAGAGVKGEFEQRLKDVVNEVKASPTPVILFVDEAHTLIGAGGQAGQNDAANLLKPALARGELRTVAATTWSDYKKHFEKDHALVRRFQVIHVKEPEPEHAVEMLRSVAQSLESYHGVRILDEAIVDAVKLSHRYISGRKLPDKSVSLLDTACARVAVSQHATPEAIEDIKRCIHLLGQEIAILKRDCNLNGSSHSRIDNLEEERIRSETRLEKLEQRWRDERKLIDDIRAASDELERLESGDPQLEDQRERLQLMKRDLKQLQGKTPMAHAEVDADCIASVVSGWTGIPVGKMMTDEIKSVLSLKEKMEERLIGQSHALEAIGRRIRTSRARLEDPDKPIGVFLLVGPSGVGKTETALTLAELLYGGEDNVITVNMSEYQEAHTVSGLKGAPPGYVGYGTGGVLTEAVRRQPFSVVLLDEVEKAHPDVMELFYQVFDKGIVEDGEGVRIDFKNTVIILTSNLGSEEISHLCNQTDSQPDPEVLQELIRPRLLQHFKPAFLGRLVVVPYYQLGADQIREIVRLKTGRIQKRFQENNHAQLSLDPKLIEAITARCTEVESGARNIDAILTHQLLPELSEKILLKMADGQAFSEITVSLDDSGQFAYQIQ